MNQTTSGTASLLVGHATATVTGIDIGKHSAKLVVAKQKGLDRTVTHASCLRFPKELQQNAMELTRALVPWLHENGEPGSRLFVATLASSMVDYEVVDGVSHLPEDIEAFAQETLIGVLGTDANLATYDSWIGVQSETQQTRCLAWTSTEFAAQLSQGLLRGGWQCTAIDVPAQALARVAAMGYGMKGSTIVADIGSGEITFVFSNGVDCEYVRNRIEFSSASAAESISNSLGIGVNAAETLLENWGIGDSDSHSKHAIESLLTQHLFDWKQKLLYEVRRTLQFFKHRHGPSSKGELILCGGGSNIRGLPQWLASELGIPVRIAELPAAWNWDAAESYSPLYTQALSLTTYGATL